MENKNKDNKKELNPFFKFSGIGMQLLFTIAAGVWIGKKVDEYMGNTQPWGAIICSITFMILGLYLFIKSLPKV
ncbi:MAG: AtpZ/AtpI family protein [Bacteroidota bacterium]